MSILFIGHEQYHELFHSSKEKIQNTKIDVQFKTENYCDECFREKIQKIIDEKQLDNLESEIKNIIFQLRDGNLDNIPRNLHQLRFEVLRSVEFAANDENYFNLMTILDNNQQKLKEVEIKINKLIDIHESASSRIESIKNLVKTNSPLQIQTSIRSENMKYEKLLNDLLRMEPKKYLPVSVSNTVTPSSASYLVAIMDMLKKIPYPSVFSKDDQRNLEYKVKDLLEKYQNISNRALELENDEKSKQNNFKQYKDDIDNKIEISKKLQEFKSMLLQLCTESE
jgi:hypothetical protein